MIAPIKKTQTARGSSSQMSSKPLCVCAACRGVDAGALCVGDGGRDVDGEAGAGVVVDGEAGAGVVVDGEAGAGVVVDGEAGAGVVGTGVVAVGARGNC
jgi:hypothetical protein